MKFIIINDEQPKNMFIEETDLFINSHLRKLSNVFPETSEKNSGLSIRRMGFEYSFCHYLGV